MRGTGVGGGNDEREQTLNQILVGMDVFWAKRKSNRDGGLTNRPDVLDPITTWSILTDVSLSIYQTVG